MSKMIFTYTRSDVLNKKLQKDDQGWYKVNLGAVNAFNAHGAFYTQDNVRELIYNPDSRMGQKLENGYLIGEMEHPCLIGLSPEQAFNRITFLDRANQSHHIKKIELEETDIPVGNGFPGNVILITGWVKPCGPKGEYLKQCIEDPEINTAFSIRALSKIGRVAGVEVRSIQSIVTFDWVTEPGITSANKFDTNRISTESYTNFKSSPYQLHSVDLPYSYTEEGIINMADKIISSHSSATCESSVMSILSDIKRNQTKQNGSKIFKKW